MLRVWELKEILQGYDDADEVVIQFATIDKTQIHGVLDAKINYLKEIRGAKGRFFSHRVLSLWVGEFISKRKRVPGQVAFKWREEE